MERFACRYRCWLVAALTLALPNVCRAQGLLGANLVYSGFRLGSAFNFVSSNPREGSESTSSPSAEKSSRVGDWVGTDIFVHARIQTLALAITKQRQSGSGSRIGLEIGNALLGEQLADLGAMTGLLSLLTLMESIPVESSAIWSVWQDDFVTRPQMLPHQVIRDVSQSMWRRLSVGLAISSGLLIGTGGLLVRSNSARFPHFRGYFRPQWSKRKIGVLFSGRF